MKRIRKTDRNKVELIKELYELSKKEEAPIWKRIAKELEKSTKRMRTVNIYKIEKHCKEGETALIPGKVLSMGELKKNVSVILVSHDLDLIRKNCKKAIWLSQGKIIKSGKSKEVIREYLK